MLPDAMRHASGHGGSAVFISAEFINALVEDREPEIDLYESLAMTVPGIVAHQSAFKEGEQLAGAAVRPAEEELVIHHSLPGFSLAARATDSMAMAATAAP